MLLKSKVTQATESINNMTKLMRDSQETCNDLRTQNKRLIADIRAGFISKNPSNFIFDS